MLVEVQFPSAYNLQGAPPALPQSPVRWWRSIKNLWAFFTSRKTLRWPSWELNPRIASENGTGENRINPRISCSDCKQLRYLGGAILAKCHYYSIPPLSRSENVRAFRTPEIGVVLKNAITGGGILRHPLCSGVELPPASWPSRYFPRCKKARRSQPLHIVPGIKHHHNYFRAGL